MSAQIYKRAGYEFQVVETKGNVSRAIGRRGKATLHDVSKEIDGKTTIRTYISESQAIDKFTQATQ
jgi:hypothetical protein